MRNSQLFIIWSTSREDIWTAILKGSRSTAKGTAVGNYAIHETTMGSPTMCRWRGVGIRQTNDNKTKGYELLPKTRINQLHGTFRLFVNADSTAPPQSFVLLLPGLRSRRFLGGVEEFFVRLRKFNSVNFYITLINWACWNGAISYETFVETENSCCVPRFLLNASCYKTLDRQTSLTLR